MYMYVRVSHTKLNLHCKYSNRGDSSLPAATEGWTFRFLEFVLILPSEYCHTENNTTHITVLSYIFVRTGYLSKMAKKCADYWSGVSWRHTSKPIWTRSRRLSAACVHVMAMILASLTSKYHDLSAPLRSSSKARNSCRHDVSATLINGVKRYAQASSV